MRCICGARIQIEFDAKECGVCGRKFLSERELNERRKEQKNPSSS